MAYKNLEVRRAKARAYSRLWRLRHPHYRPARRTPYNPALAPQRWLRWKYGISVADRDALFARQLGKCLICGERNDLVIDHDHATGKIRGGLCQHCNRGLGLFRDRPDLLSVAVAYLLLSPTGQSDAPDGVPPSAGGVAKSGEAVDAVALARSVVANYFTARANAEQLNALIANLRDMHKK